MGKCSGMTGCQRRGFKGNTLVEKLVQGAGYQLGPNAFYGGVTQLQLKAVASHVVFPSQQHVTAVLPLVQVDTQPLPPRLPSFPAGSKNVPLA